MTSGTSDLRVKDFTKFIEAREFARKTKELRGQVSAKEISRRVAQTDPIIAEFRFCNVRRNDDRVTKYIHANYLHPLKLQPHVWFAIVVARLFNNEPTLDAIMAHVLPFRPESMLRVLYRREQNDEKNFNAAYIVSTNGRAMRKVDYVVEHVLRPLWDKRAAIAASLKGATLGQMHELLNAQNGLGSFMAAQVVADLKYIQPWLDAPDFADFAAPGPGSLRGMKRVMGRGFDVPLSAAAWHKQMGVLVPATRARLRWPEPLTAQDIQNCLCEFDKYERARTGEGRPKQKYTPAEGEVTC